MSLRIGAVVLLAMSAGGLVAWLSGSHGTSALTVVLAVALPLALVGGFLSARQTRR